jgi:hypothetical protein
MKLAKAAEYLPLIIAAAQGQRIQVNDGGDKWVTSPGSLAFSREARDYRIHPDDVKPQQEFAYDKIMYELWYRLAEQNGAPDDGKWLVYQTYTTALKAKEAKDNIFGVDNIINSRNGERRYETYIMPIHRTIPKK